ncbi:cbb3-type cytochrome oxidase assembly protein CcoS [Cellvibrio sp.]|uniref:cbb3-type cytochrome oxidase assembly protein CcoS n=1 Tax=Cellvibrio sp. TaxID=1965322 RepID=UPI0039648993
MESLYFLVPCALIFIAIAVKVLFWAINNGQYDNLDTEAHRILFDDEKNKAAAKTTSPSQEPASKIPEQDK